MDSPQNSIYKKIRTFDIDGVVWINKDVKGLRPDPDDIIITGRSYEEREETEAMLAKRGIKNKVMFNDLPFEEKTRETAGEHKANCIKALFSAGYQVTAHFEDDEVQAAVIMRECPDVPVIMIVHNLTEKENKRNYDF
jgi:nicotinic acid phosphoribosyltransferase